MELLKEYIQTHNLQALRDLFSTSSLTRHLLKEGDFSFPLCDSSLMFALSDNVIPSLDVIKFLVEEVCVDINKCNVYSVSPVIQSTLHHNILITEYLLSKGADTGEYFPLNDEKNILFWLEEDGDPIFKEQVIQALTTTKKCYGGGKRICIRN